MSPICQSESNILCPDKFGCPVPMVCPDFEIKRHDTKPGFTITVSDCDGPLDLVDTIVEASMWAKAKLKRPLADSDTFFALSDNIGFEQSLVGDIIVAERVRSPEQMLIVGYDETNKLIQVQRGYNGSAISSYPRGNVLRIFRVINAVGETHMINQDIEDVDGSIRNELVESQLVFNWRPNDTCLPGCYWFEFKLLKMVTSGMWFMGDVPVVPSFTNVASTMTGCDIGAGVEWVRRFPVNSDGFLVHITNSPSSENVQ